MANMRDKFLEVGARNRATRGEVSTEVERDGRPTMFIEVWHDDGDGEDRGWRFRQVVDPVGGPQEVLVERDGLTKEEAYAFHASALKVASR